MSHSFSFMHTLYVVHIHIFRKCLEKHAAMPQPEQNGVTWHAYTRNPAHQWGIDELYVPLSLLPKPPLEIVFHLSLTK